MQKSRSIILFLVILAGTGGQQINPHSPQPQIQTQTQTQTQTQDIPHGWPVWDAHRIPVTNPEWVPEVHRTTPGTPPRR